MTLSNLFQIIEKGGPGSGHKGHAGRPGKRGGSALSSTGNINFYGFSKVTSIDEVGTNNYYTKPAILLGDGDFIDIGEKHHFDVLEEIVEKGGEKELGIRQGSSLEEAFLEGKFFRVGKILSDNSLFIHGGKLNKSNLKKFKIIYLMEN